MERWAVYVTMLFLTVTNVFECIMGYDRRTLNKTNDKIVFPESVESSNEVQEIPLEIIRRLNEVSSMEEFMRMMVDPSDSEPVGIANRMGVEDVERNAVRTAKGAKCMPELTTVSLKPENTVGVYYYPPCTRVQRCGGCCSHELVSCQPVESEIIPMSVVVVEYKGGPLLQFKETKIVEVEQHTKCKCDCKTRAEDCSKYQKYNPHKCQCECTNVDKERKCYKEAPKKIWSPRTCSCECREVPECGSGFEFDPFTCNCVPARGRKRPNFVYETVTSD